MWTVPGSNNHEGMLDMAHTDSEVMYCELCGDERVASDLNSELRCPPCAELEERNETEGK